LKKKLIEVALPLEAINKESAREKSIRHGHPSTLHLWWARRPLAACRAVLFASLVDDPGSRPDLFPTEEEQHAERERLFDLISELVKWDNSNKESLLRLAKDAILRSAGPDGPPPVYDPFCGGGSIPFEAQRLGLRAHGSDLNPVAVLITKALIEIPPHFFGQPPMNPEWTAKASRPGMWKGIAGFAEDVRYYGNWMRQQALDRLGHLYPPVKLHDGSEATVIAWLWARTVACPNPACGATMPLARSFSLSTKKGQETWVQPVIEPGEKRVKFSVNCGSGAVPEPPKIGRGAKFRCLFCGQVAADDYIKSEGQVGRMGAQLMSIVADGPRSRVYVEPNDAHEVAASIAEPPVGPKQELAHDPRNIWCREYGLRKFGDLFTDRQLLAMTTFSGLVLEARQQALVDGLSLDRANALSIYLAFAVDKMADTNSQLCTWQVDPPRLRATFGRQALPMTWDYAEAGIFADAAGDFRRCVLSITEVLEKLNSNTPGTVVQLDAAAEVGSSVPFLFCTDPPYYDNIAYGDLADYFYVWLRKSLDGIEDSLFQTMLVPKGPELVATPYRFDGDRQKAQDHFESGFGRAVASMHDRQHRDYPLSIFYAFKQAESESEGEDGAEAVASTGWETMLEGVLRSGFAVTGTWPMRSELSTRNIGRGTNALASSIVLVCRPRLDSATITTRKDFLAALKSELPPALRALQQGNIAPVDLAQAAIGPGMAVFSRYAKVLENDGSPMKVRTALQLINQMLDEVLSEQESDFDPDTRFALTWFEQRGFDEGPYGDAETLATARAISVNGLTESGIASARAGKVKLIARKDLPSNWAPTADGRLTVWEATQYLIRALEEKGESGAAELAAKLGGLGETARELAYRLYTLCERKGWTEEAIAYNSLVVSWPAISHQAKELAKGSQGFELTAG
jgi:putative DNA methylase